MRGRHFRTLHREVDRVYDLLVGLDAPLFVAEQWARYDPRHGHFVFEGLGKEKPMVYLRIHEIDDAIEEGLI